MAIAAPHCCFIGGARRVVRMLLKSGNCASCINDANTFGNTALHFAHEFGFDSVVRQLAKRGASVGMVNEVGCIPGDRVDMNTV